MLRRTLFALLSILLVAPVLHASCGAASCPIELHPGSDSGLTFDLSFQYIDQRHLRQSTPFDGEEEHRELRTINRLTALQVNAPVSSRFQLGVTVPFVDRWHEHIELHSNALERWSFHSIGDIAVQMRAKIVDFATRSPQSLWLTAALKLPTGDKSEPALGGGEDAEVMIVPGSGSYDAVVGLAFNGAVVRNTVLEGPFGRSTSIPYFVTAAYRRNGRGTDDYRIGNELQMSAGTEYPVTSRVDLLAQVNGRLRSKDAPGTTGENPALTGGRYLYASPGLRVEIGRNASAYAYVQLPVYQHVNGIQLTSRANYLAGVRQRF